MLSKSYISLVSKIRVACPVRSWILPTLVRDKPLSLLPLLGGGRGNHTVLPSEHVRGWEEIKCGTNEPGRTVLT